MKTVIQKILRTSGQRFVLALILSFLLHGGLFAAGVFQSRMGWLGEREDTIYQVSDVLEDLVETAAEHPDTPLKQQKKRHVSQMKFILLDKNTLDRLDYNTATIAGQIQEEKSRQEKNTIPVSKNPSLKPKIISYSPVPYPTDAEGAVGTVVVCILVGYDGRPEYTSLTESSGNRFLDAAAVEHCIGWRFTPARDGKGRIVRCLLYIPVRVTP